MRFNSTAEFADAIQKNKELSHSIKNLVHETEKLEMLAELADGDIKMKIRDIAVEFKDLIKDTNEKYYVLIELLNKQ